MWFVYKLSYKLVCECVCVCRVSWSDVCLKADGKTSVFFFCTTTKNVENIFYENYLLKLIKHFILKVSVFRL